MLSYPDRHRFEEIRSRWEAAQAPDRKYQTMVGRKETLDVARQRSDRHESSNASKFRRKLSQGLSLISLSQRKTTPVRLLLPSNDLRTSTDVPHPHRSARSSPPAHSTSSDDVTTSDMPFSGTVSPQKVLNNKATPKQLPRSRTMSFIPRLSQAEPETRSCGIDVKLPLHHPNSLEKTRITPMHTPSPRTNSSVETLQESITRQHNPGLMAQKTSFRTIGDASVGMGNRSLPKPSAARSHTTPNLMRTTRLDGPNNSTSPRKLSQQRPSGIPEPRRPEMKENSMPITPRHVKRLSNIQEHYPHSPNQEGPMTSTCVSKKKSKGPAHPLVSSKQKSSTTSPVSNKRRGSQHVTQTPFSEQRAIPKKRSPVHQLANSQPAIKVNTYPQTRLLGPVSPPSPPDTDSALARTVLPRASTGEESYRRACSGPKKRMGGGILARSQALANKEVRVPRSSTLHHFPGAGDIPPVPQIPEKYKFASMPILVPTEKVSSQASNNSDDERTHQEVEHQKTTSRFNGGSLTDSHQEPESSDIHRGSILSSIRLPKQLCLERNRSDPSVQEPAPGRSVSASLLPSAKSAGSRSAKIPHTLNITDSALSLQVKDYMPPLYWAGRFQSRYDQWRTEAMHVELDPEYRMDGSLAHCNVHQEKAASCHIFLQLRELCLSNQAADSLWEFEHKYRQDNDLLGASYDLPLLKNKRDDARQGSIGRAIRKMTPRKSSLVNLLKGKG